MTAKMGWLDRIVNVQWGGKWFVIIFAYNDLASVDPTEDAQLVYSRDFDPATEGLHGFVHMYEIDTGGAKKKVADVIFGGTAGGEVYTFAAKDHDFDPTNTDRMPLGGPNGNVYFPLDPSDGEKDDQLLNNPNNAVYIKNGTLTIL